MAARTNVAGQPLTKRLFVDKRSLRAGKRAPRENDGKPYMLYGLMDYPSDARRWHVVGWQFIDGKRGKYELISRHVSKERASAKVERLKMAQPNRKQSKKLAHKLQTGRLIDE